MDGGRPWCSMSPPLPHDTLARSITSVKSTGPFPWGAQVPSPGRARCRIPAPSTHFQRSLGVAPESSPTKVETSWLGASTSNSVPSRQTHSSTRVLSTFFYWPLESSGCLRAMSLISHWRTKSLEFEDNQMPSQNYLTRQLKKTLLM